MTTGERIKNLRISRGLTQEELGKLVGVQKAAIYKYEQGLIVNLKRDVIEKLSLALDCAPSYLMCIDDDQPPLPPGCIPLPPTNKVPLIGRIACGTPITAEQNVEGYASIPSDWHADFALLCRGDSMAPSIRDGDLVAIHSQPEVENGEIAAVLIGDEATLKRVYRYDDRLVLQPENPAFPPIIKMGSEIDDIRIEGKAIGICRKF